MAALDPQIRDQAYQFFSQEAVEFLQIIEEGLLGLQDDRSIPKIHNLMRAAHSIKGGAASIELTGIQHIAHRLEDVFRALYRLEQVIDNDIEELLLQAFDALRAPLLEQFQTGTYDAAAAIAAAEPIFSVLDEYLGGPGDDFELPTAAELGFDITQSVFAGDVSQGIERLQTVLEHPEKEQVAGEIRAQAEVFAGIGELLNLPGFNAIAKHVLQALNVHAEDPVRVGTVAVENFLAAQAAVLAGDRTQGGVPSEALLRLLDAVPPALDTTSQTTGGSTVREDDPWSSLEALLGVAPADEENRTATGDLGIAVEGLGIADGDFGIADEDLETADAVWGDAAGLQGIAAGGGAEEPKESAFATFDDVFSGDRADEDDDSDFARIFSEPEDNPAHLTDVFGSPAIAAMPHADPIPVERDEPLSMAIAATLDELNVSMNEPLAPGRLTPDEPTMVTGIVAKSQVESKTQPIGAAPTAMSEVVRVDLSRMERLNNLVGELVTQENGAMLQTQQMQAFLGSLKRRFEHFEGLTKELQQWLDQSQKLQVSLQDAGVKSAQSNPADGIPAIAEFDSLLLDSYGGLYTMMQGALEEIAQMDECIRDMESVAQQSVQTQTKKQQTLRQVRNDLLWARMMPLSDVLNRFPRMVRDMSAKYGKQVTLKLAGTTTLVDKAMLEKLFDPLVHLVRNAFDHGTDTPQERRAKGKPPEATIEIRSYRRGNQTYIEVRDDGKGIDPEKVRTAIVTKELLDADSAASLTLQQIYDYLFAPGFSTAAAVTDLSGRGVGLSSVLEQVQSLKGTLSIASEIGKGTTFTIRLPLTLTIAKLLVFRVDATLMAVPVDSLVAIVSAPNRELQTIQGRYFYRYQEQLLPLYPPSVFSSHYPLPRHVSGQSRPMELPSDEDSTPLLIVSSGSDFVALEIDEIVNEQELVIKPFGKAIAPPSYLYGCTILGDGSLVPVVDGSALVNRWTHTVETIVGTGHLSTDELSAVESGRDRTARQSTAASGASLSAPTILIIDDSLTTRQTLSATLSKAGHFVIQAGDGREGLEKLRQNPDIRGIFCDIEMPNMNGFEFLNNFRAEFSDRRVPIIMLTSRSSQKHRQLAAYLGAVAYLTKPFLEQELLQTLRTSLEKPEGSRTAVTV